MQEGDAVTAEVYLQKAVLQSEESSQRTQYFMEWIRVLLEKGDLELASQILQQSFEYGVNEEQLSYLRGMVYFEKEDYNSALQMFQTAQNNTMNAELLTVIYKQESSIYWIQGNYAESIELLRKASDFSANRNLQRELAEACMDYSICTVDSRIAREYRHEAINIYENLNDSMAPAFLDRMNLAVLYLTDGQYEAAEQLLIGLAGKYDDYRIDMYMAYIAYHRGDMEEVVSLAERAHGIWVQAGKPADDNMDQLMLLVENL